MNGVLIDINSIPSSVENFEAEIEREQMRICSQFVDAVIQEMQEQELTQTDLAWTLNKKRPYISRVLASKQNMTIKTMIEISHALDLRLDIKFKSQRNCGFKNIIKFNPDEALIKRAISDMRSSCGDDAVIGRAM